MYLELLDLLKCPDCGGSFRLHCVEKRDGEDIEQGSLICSCGLKVSIQEGVVDFNSKEQDNTNNWSECYEMMSYEELDKQVSDKTAPNLKELFEKTKEHLVSYLNTNKPSVVLDMATGRGMLATYVAKNAGYTPHFICTDLSFPVLKYDRLKVRKINPDFKVSFIACDCTSMPLKSEVIDCAVSFLGIVNMLDFAASGIEDAHRLLNPGSLLLNTAILVDQTSRVAADTFKVVSEQFNINCLDKLSSRVDLMDMHKDGGFTEVEILNIGQGIGEKNETDAIPIEGEWFAIIIKCIK